MSTNGFKVMDSDMHVNEPWDMYLNYIDPEYKERAPVGVNQDPVDMNTALEGDILAPFLAKQDLESHEEERYRLDITHKKDNEYIQEGIERRFDPVSQVNAMKVGAST